MTIRTNPSLGFGLDTVLPADGSWLDVAGTVSTLLLCARQLSRNRVCRRM